MVDIKTMQQRLGLIFSDEQIPVIEWKNKPLSVIACAGSGKTTTIELNMIYKTLNYRVNPTDMLCITFSKTSQLDMDNRYNKLYEIVAQTPPIERPHFTTFHALFKRILEYFKGERFKVVQIEKYKYQLMRAIGFKSANNFDLNELIDAIANYRSSLINTLESIDGLENIENIPDALDFTYDEYKKVISTYLDLKKQHDEIDFEDMQSLLLEMLEDDNKREAVIQYFNNTYKHVYIDEFQDISPIQYAIIDIMLNEDYSNFTVIGDDDQSIYKFRGSSSDFILQFPNQIQGSQTLYLSTNYRCKSNILNNVKTSIEMNERRFKKDFQSHRKGGKIGIIKDKPDFERICGYIQQHVKEMGEDYATENFVVLSRIKFQLSLVADALMERHIDVRFKNKNDALQMNRFYQEIFNIIKMIKKNDSEIVKNYAYKIIKGLSKEKAKSVAREVDYTQSYWLDIAKIKVSNQKEMKETEKSILAIKNESNLEKILINVFDLLKGFYKSMSKRGSKNFDYFKDVVNYLQDIAKKDGINYYQFVEKERAKAQRINQNIINGNGISIMTFHGSKGLEFENVYMIGVDNIYIPGASKLQYDIENRRLYSCFATFEEERRLFYVATTRAKNNLFISYNSSKPSVFIHELKDMDNQRRATVIDAIDDNMSKFDLAKTIYKKDGSYTDFVTEDIKGYLNTKLEKQAKDLIQSNKVKNKKQRKDYKFR
ncbi:ATP-dependent helicase [Staphylococcus capitis]|uniref:ATP-dependent helicase n=1 Tax=Staphylococcus capitis TaxID=29388 RepID=UPI00247FA868|nr:ATP-dependent helicase [Staphylococcus capitis]MDH9600710.1 ATP-dependent helicase [Staphylococcus capitis]MDH9624376.1 ATP-dependent helicase [Staphylococcus capitis]